MAKLQLRQVAKNATRGLFNKFLDLFYALSYHISLLRIADIAIEDYLARHLYSAPRYQEPNRLGIHEFQMFFPNGRRRHHCRDLPPDQPHQFDLRRVWRRERPGEQHDGATPARLVWHLDRVLQKEQQGDPKKFEAID